MASDIQTPTDGPGDAAPGGPAPAPEPADPHRRVFELIALLLLLSACAAICVLADLGVLQAAVSSTGILFAAWEGSQRTGRRSDRRRR